MVMPEAKKNPDMIGKIEKPPPMKCIPGCKVQTNAIEMSFAPYPQREIFFHKKTFCNLASHIRQVTCQNENRKFFIDKKQPNLCSILNEFDDYFGSSSSCQEWPGNFFQNYDDVNVTLEDEMYEYGRQNLALVHVVMQSPYVTKIKRDVAMTFTTYVANTGGLLGLCLGFSLISTFELFFWCYKCCQEIKKRIGTDLNITRPSIVRPIKIRE